jgi:hypothetical protein
VSDAVIVLVSLVTPKASDEQIAGLTYSSITPAQKAEERVLFHKSADIVRVSHDIRSGS